VSKEAIKSARGQIMVAYKAYRKEVKKHRLFKKQASIKDTLKQMGVPNRSINVICYDTPAQKIKVRVGV
jgi:hypothetical protein